MLYGNVYFLRWPGVTKKSCSFRGSLTILENNSNDRKKRATNGLTWEYKGSCRIFVGDGMARVTFSARKVEFIPKVVEFPLWSRNSGHSIALLESKQWTYWQRE